MASFKTSYLKTEKLHENQKALDLKEVQLEQDVCTRWNSVFYMIDRLLSAYPAVFTTLYQGPNKHLLLTDDEQKLLEQLAKVLAPFERASTKFSAEKIPTAGLILPYFAKFLKDLAPAPDDLPQIIKVKDLIKKDLEKRYQKPEEKSLLALTSVLDPRLKSLDWMEVEERNQVFKSLHEECLKNPVQRRFTPWVPPVEIKQEPGTESEVKLETQSVPQSKPRLAQPQRPHAMMTLMG